MKYTSSWNSMPILSCEAATWVLQDFGQHYNRAIVDGINPHLEHAKPVIRCRSTLCGPGLFSGTSKPASWDANGLKNYVCDAPRPSEMQQSNGPSHNSERVERPWCGVHCEHTVFLFVYRRRRKYWQMGWQTTVCQTELYQNWASWVGR